MGSFCIFSVISINSVKCIETQLLKIRKMILVIMFFLLNLPYFVAQIGLIVKHNCKTYTTFLYFLNFKSYSAVQFAQMKLKSSYK